jgi:hypothetical protein
MEILQCIKMFHGTSSKKKDAEMLIKQLGFSSIGRKKGAVKKLEILIGGGFMFAMCSLQIVLIFHLRPMG